MSRIKMDGGAHCGYEELIHALKMEDSVGTKSIGLKDSADISP